MSAILFCCGFCRRLRLWRFKFCPFVVQNVVVLAQCGGLFFNRRYARRIAEVVAVERIRRRRKIILQANVMPADFAGDAQVLAVLLLSFVGAALVLALSAVRGAVELYGKAQTKF